jgi:hypothetical protein
MTSPAPLATTGHFAASSGGLHGPLSEFLLRSRHLLLHALRFLHHFLYVHGIRRAGFRL